MHICIYKMIFLKQMFVVIQDNVCFSVFIMLYFMHSYFHTLLAELQAIENISEFIIVIGLHLGQP